ncbi:hypothetical protein HPP92_014121 [Vanilla planifolia]|uniref:Uncharacterized protein n=1 Tax=Vanilla planifolia TaxID=51239 RepID=A0A835UYM7_VANPL|nr:hypothetical protein HPP92_014121 [Vanilla planifolia]
MEAISTCVDQVNSSESSCCEDENMKVTSGCPRFDEAASKEASRCLNTPTGKDGWNESQEWTVLECVYSNDEGDCKRPDLIKVNSGCGGSFTDKSIDGSRKSSSNPCSVDQVSSSMSVHWEDGDKKETGDSCNEPRVNRKIGWNESRGLNAQELADSCNENSYRKPNLDGSGEFSPKCYWKKSAIWTASKGYSTGKDHWECNKCGLCTSGSFGFQKRDWKGFNDRRENGHGSGWDEPFIHKDPDEGRKLKLKTCFDNQARSRKCGQWKDGDPIKATNRWSKWDFDASQKNQQYPRFPSRKGNSNVSLIWAASESGDFGENVYRDPSIVQSLFRSNARVPTKQLSPTSSPNSALLKSESCTIAEKAGYHPLFGSIDSIRGIIEIKEQELHLMEIVCQEVGGAFNISTVVVIVFKLILMRILQKLWQRSAIPSKMQ